MRKSWVNKLDRLIKQGRLRNNNVICVDEKGFRVGKQGHHHGWSPKGSYAYKKAYTDSHGKYVSFICAISPYYGVVHYMTHEKHTHGEQYAEYLRGLGEKLKALGKDENGEREWFMYADGVSVHWTPECLDAIRDFTKDTSHNNKLNQLKLPPYCPFLNPVEMTWHHVQDIIDKEQPHGPTALRDGINRGVTWITQEVCYNSFRHVGEAYYDACRKGAIIHATS